VVISKMPLFLKYFICIDAIPLDYRVDLLVLYRSTGKPKKCDFAWRNKSNNTDCTGFSRLGWVLQVACFASNFRACSRKDCGIAAKAQQAKHVPFARFLRECSTLRREAPATASFLALTAFIPTFVAPSILTPKSLARRVKCAA